MSIDQLTEQEKQARLIAARERGRVIRTLLDWIEIRSPEEQRVANLLVLEVVGMTDELIWEDSRLGRFDPEFAEQERAEVEAGKDWKSA